MADNVEISAGEGTPVATDDIGGVQYQRVKVVWGTDGTANDADTASGKALPIQVRNSTGTEIATAANPLRVDVTGDTAQPVTDNGGSLTVDNGGTFAVQAAQSGTWNITNISGTISLPTGAATAAKQPALGTAGTASSDVITVQGIASMTALKVDGSAMTQPVSGTVTVTQATATNLKAQVVGTGTFAVQAAQSGTWNITNAGTFAVQASAATSGGATPYKLISAASTNATSVKGSAGQLYMIAASNVNASARYLKLYNKATAPTVGTDTPVHVFLIPGGTTGAGTNIPVPDCGLAFGTGIAFALTTGVADSDTGAVAASDIVVNLAYK